MATMDYQPSKTISNIHVHSTLRFDHVFLEVQRAITWVALLLENDEFLTCY